MCAENAFAPKRCTWIFPFVKFIKNVLEWNKKLKKKKKNEYEKNEDINSNQHVKTEQKQRKAKQTKLFSMGTQRNTTATVNYLLKMWLKKNKFENKKNVLLNCEWNQTFRRQTHAHNRRSCWDGCDASRRRMLRFQPINNEHFRAAVDDHDCHTAASSTCVWRPP